MISDYGKFEVDKKYIKISRLLVVPVSLVSVCCFCQVFVGFLSVLCRLLVRYLPIYCRFSVCFLSGVSRFLVRFLSASCQVLVVMVRPLMDKSMMSQWDWELVLSNSYKAVPLNTAREKGLCTTTIVRYKH